MTEKLLSFLNLNPQEFTFQFQSHPNFPSALAFSDTLHFLGVKNDAYELEKEFWGDLPQEFITIYKDNFALVKKEKENYTLFSDKEEKISKSQLLENSQNFVLLFEKDEGKIQKPFAHFPFQSFFPFTLFVIGFSLWQFPWQQAIFNVLSLVGMYISLEIFRQKLGTESAVINNLCGGNAANNTSSCDKIIQSDKINIFEKKIYQKL
jgi:ABC-type bacteriocin/lantibiotic exporter with double-glycine peptidase domain